MAGFDYIRTKATATRLLEKFGIAVTYKIKAEAKYNPATGKVEHGFLGELWDGQINGVFIVMDDFAESDIDGTLIRQGDQLIYLDPELPVNPKSGDVVVVPVLENGVHVRNDDYEVIRPRPIAPAAVVVLHRVHARRA